MMKCEKKNFSVCRSVRRAPGSFPKSDRESMADLLNDGNSRGKKRQVQRRTVVAMELFIRLQIAQLYF